MKHIVFALPGIVLTILCWGTYGPVLHRGQEALGDRLKPLMCVGAAYFIVGIIVPLAMLIAAGKLSGGWTFRGVSWSMMAGAAGAVGALGVVLALSSGGKPIYVMPLVFGGAPIINVLVSMYFQGITWKDMGARFPAFLSGVIMVAVGAAMVLIFAPRGSKDAPRESPAAATAQFQPADDPAAAEINASEPKSPPDGEQTT
jgi:hypothetical protein